MKLKMSHTNENSTDMLTQVLTKEKFELCAGLADMDYS